MTSRPTTSREVVQLVGTGREQSHYRVGTPILLMGDPRESTTGGATMHYWWYDHIRPICDRLRFGSQVRRFEHDH